MKGENDVRGSRKKRWAKGHREEEDKQKEQKHTKIEMWEEIKDENEEVIEKHWINIEAVQRNSEERGHRVMWLINKQNKRYWDKRYGRYWDKRATEKQGEENNEVEIEMAIA